MGGIDAIAELSQQIGRLAAAQDAAAASFAAHDREEVEERRLRMEREAEEIRRLHSRLDEMKARQDQMDGAYRAIITVGSVLAGAIGIVLTAFSALKN